MGTIRGLSGVDEIRSSNYLNERMFIFKLELGNDKFYKSCINILHKILTNIFGYF